jgi:integrase
MKGRGPYARRPAPPDEPPRPAATAIQTIGGEPKVYWNARHRVFFGKYKRDGVWRNKLVPVNIDDEHKATLWFAAWLRGLAKTGVAPVNGEVTLEERKTIRSLGDLWLRWQSEQHPGDRKIETACHRLLDTWTFPHPIADVDLERELDLGQCTAWVEWVKKSGRAPNTVRNIVQGLRGFLVDVRGKGWVRLRENLLLDPFIRKMVAGAEPLAGRNTIIHLRKEQARQLLLCASVDIPALRRIRTLLAVATGCRAAELAALRWEDVDLEAPVPTVRVFQQFKGHNRVRQPQFKEPKKKSHRILPLHPTAAMALRWWKETGWATHVGRAPAPPDAVLANFRGEHSMSKWCDTFREDLETAGIPTVFDGKHPLTFHALRRTFMSLLEGEGVSRDLIGALAGHAGKTVSDRHYIAKNVERFYEVVKHLPLPEKLPWLPSDLGEEVDG